MARDSYDESATNYDKEKMADLRNDLSDKKQKFNSCIDDMTEQMDVIKSNWVENDVDAQKVLSNFEAQCSNYKKKLYAAVDIIDTFLNKIDEQIGDYTVAEKSIRV